MTTSTVTKTASSEAAIHQDVTRVQVGDKRIDLIGTAHISQQSVETVLQFIEGQKPDTVCIELDEARFETMQKEVNWEDINLIEILKQKKMTFFIAKLTLTAFQRNMSQYTGVKPGSEMVAAVDKAKELGSKLVLIDRDISTTLLRAWRMTPFLQKSSLLGALVMSIFQKTEMDEDELAKMRQQDNLSEMLDEIGKEIPFAKKALLDERDSYMAEKILQTEGELIAVVIGAAHKPGIERKLREQERASLKELEEVPPKSFLSKVLPWLLPAFIIGAFVLGFIYGDIEKAKEAIYAWVIVNAIGGGVGAMIALAHPLAILTAIVAAPITSLNPTLGVGMVAGMAQAWFAPPKVSDFERIGDDFTPITNLWRNRLGRLLLVFVLSGIGSSIATLVSFKWIIPLLTT